MPIRVLDIIGSLRLGGAQVCLKQIVENNEDPEIEHYVYPLRSRQIDIPINGHIIKLPYRNYDPRKFFAIFSLCKKYKIDIIHAHLHKPVIGALLARLFLNLPVIVHEHCSIAYRGIEYSLYRLALRILRRKASVYIAVSKATEDDLKKLAKVEASHIQVIYNAVDLTRFTPDPLKRDRVREELNIAPDDIVIGFVGRLSSVKGTELIVEALSLLLKNNPKYRGLFLGSGPQRESLLQRAKALHIEHRVNFLGFRDDVSDILNVFDIAVMPSRKEGLPLTALEYMSMKIPIISSGVDGLGEILTDRQNALILKENTASNIFESVCELQDNNELKQTLADNAHRFVQDFSIRRFTGHINALYRKLKEIH